MYIVSVTLRESFVSGGEEDCLGEAWRVFVTSAGGTH